ncbi:hypothetical protein WICPIJ_006419 [Wickerhamomyces pijperi]|uniref:Uncharacterized protein n=1 Tax=Wickerhamomyces pijperi TaxID=599730 RepID=A0A9P8TL17_WICPI|nr:hypothetical protein WICPIJ_006419 [Wickerhamomyces pijperi]
MISLASSVVLIEPEDKDKPAWSFNVYFQSIDVEVGGGFRLWRFVLNAEVLSVCLPEEEDEDDNWCCWCWCWCCCCCCCSAVVVAEAIFCLLASGSSSAASAFFSLRCCCRVCRFSEISSILENPSLIESNSDLISSHALPLTTSVTIFLQRFLHVKLGLLCISIDIVLHLVP